MKAQKCFFRRRKFPFGQQPALITERQAGDLIRQFQLQLLASLSQGGAELEQMPLNQTGGGSDGHNGPSEWTDESLAQRLPFLGFEH